MDEVIKEFKLYLDNFDMNNGMIKYKVDHSFRVYEYSKRVIETLNLNEHDKKLGMICALLHDIGRFNQIKFYGTWYDSKSVDHGDEGYRVLKENNYIYKYVDNEEDANIVLKAVKEHNKFAIDSSLNEREMFFAKLTRDVDKIDIIFTQLSGVKISKYTVSDEMMNTFVNKSIIKYKGPSNSTFESILRQAAYLFDINFRESFVILKENNFIDVKFKNIKSSKELEKIKSILYDYLEEKVKC